MKNSKFLALIMAVVMLMSTMVLPASAVTNNPWQPQATYFTKEKEIKSAILAVVGMEGDIVDWETYTVTRTWIGETCIWVFEPDAFTWTITNVDTGEVSINQAQKPKCWYVDHILIDTATGEPVNGDAGNGHFYVNGIIVDQNTSQSTVTPEPAQTEKPAETDKQYFPDVTPDAWYYDAVNTMAANDILHGYDDGLFHPEDYVTTGELCAIIYCIGKNDNPVNRPVPDHPEYTHWASYAVWTLGNATKPYTSCSPKYAQDTANRGEAVKAIMALIEDAGIESRYTQVLSYTKDDNGISDWDIISDLTNRPRNHGWNPDYILNAYNYGIVHGKDSTGRFDPLGNLTRAELCQMLANAGLTQYTPAEMEDMTSGLGFVLG